MPPNHQRITKIVGRSSKKKYRGALEHNNAKEKEGGGLRNEIRFRRYCQNMEDDLTQIQAIATAALGAAPAGAAKAAGAAPAKAAGAAPNLDHLKAISTLATNGTADKIAVEGAKIYLSKKRGDFTELFPSETIPCTPRTTPPIGCCA